MGIIRCEKGLHFYDNVKYDKCPYCEQRKQQGSVKLPKDAYAEFQEILNKTYFAGMERVNGDIGWFIDKFDYRFKDEPWKNAKDSLPRGIIKTNHTIIES